MMMVGEWVDIIKWNNGCINYLIRGSPMYNN